MLLGCCGDAGKDVGKDAGKDAGKDMVRCNGWAVSIFLKFFFVGTVRCCQFVQIVGAGQVGYLLRASQMAPKPVSNVVLYSI